MSHDRPQAHDLPDKAASLLKLLESLSVFNAIPVEKKPKSHQFWSTQPVPQSETDFHTDAQAEDGPLKPVTDLHHEPTPLPDGFEFASFDCTNEQQLQELYVLLKGNYVEDYDSQFRFDYSKDFLLWALQPPVHFTTSTHNYWQMGIKDINGKLVAFISFVPCLINVKGKEVKVGDVNFLCIEKAYRSRRWAPLLIQEATRRSNLVGIEQGLYTAGIQLPHPLTTAQYYHRPLNNSKLVEAGFSCLPLGASKEQMDKHYLLPSSDSGLSPMTVDDIPQAFNLLSQYLSKFKLFPVMTLDEFTHWFSSKPGVVYSFVQKDKNNSVTGFVSFYDIPTSVLHEKSPHTTVNTAYLYYYAVPLGQEDAAIYPLLKSALVEARNLGFDVFNCVEIMDSTADLLKALKFGEGDGSLRYYLFNWKTTAFKPQDVAFVMH